MRYQPKPAVETAFVNVQTAATYVGPCAPRPMQGVNTG